MTAEENKKIVMEWIETFNTRDLAAIDRLAEKIFPTDWIGHNPSVPDLPHNLAGWKQMIHQIFKDFPDYQTLCEDVIAEGDKVVVRGKYFGTNETTKRLFDQHFISIARLSGGKIVETWELMVPALTRELAAG